MKKIFIILPIFMVMVWLACSKYKHTPDDIPGRTATFLRGRLFLYDSITGNYDTVPLGKQLVSIGYAASPNPLNYVYTTMTDSLGYFIFQNLDSTESYHLNFTSTDSNYLVYMADTILKPGSDSLAFVAYPSFEMNNGVLYHFVTAQDTNGAVAGVTACIFSNAAVVSDTSCTGSTWSLTSDQYGRASLFHVLQGTYYTRVHVDFPSLDTTLIDTLTIPATGLVVKKIHL
jgi:hypothetical protein